MEITFRAFMTAVHGILFGAFFLLAIYGIIVELCRISYATQSSELTRRGDSLRRLYLLGTAGLGWVAILLGAYAIYPWYRAHPPAGTAILTLYPQALLKSSASTAGWHNLGIEWKEHIAWFAPVAVTMATYVMTRYRHSMRTYPQVRTAVPVFALVALGSAGIAGLFGAMLNKYAPVQGGATIHLTGASR